MPNELRVDTAAPWKQRFRAPTILWTQLAKAAPTRGLVVSNVSGVAQLYAWHLPTGEQVQLTNRPEGQLLGLISPDGRYIYYLDDKQGNEIGHFVRVPFEGGTPEDITPNLPLYSSFNIDISYAGNLLACTLATSGVFQVYCLGLGPGGQLGTPRQVYQAAGLVIGSVLSHNGEILVLGSTARSGNLRCSLLAVTTASGQQLTELWDGPESSIEPLAFSPLADDFRLLATTDRTGVKRPLIWNPRTGERVDLVLDDLEGEVVPLHWSADGKRILLCQFSQAVQHLFVYDITNKTLQHLQHPRGSFIPWGTYFGPNGEIFTQWMDSTHPSQLVALDSATGILMRSVLAAGEVPSSHSWQSVTFPSSDGQTIQGWLGTPDGEGPFPTILEMHGGPKAVETESFAPGSQAWLDCGFAYLTINYRGSTTFGREFESQILGDLGHLEIEDIVAARKWLIEQGIARPDQILLTGWSYGGYLTLLALGKYPEMWAAGIAGMPIADWTIQYEDEAETLRGYQQALFGGTPEEKPEQYAASSPITYVEHVCAPVLIIQGCNDTRTPARPVKMYEEKMKALGKAIEVKWFDGGHLSLFAGVEQSIKLQEWMLRFAYRVLEQG